MLRHDKICFYIICERSTSANLSFPFEKTCISLLFLVETRNYSFIIKNRSSVNFIESLNEHSFKVYNFSLFNFQVIVFQNKESTANESLETIDSKL